MKRNINISLQTKLLSLIIFLLLFVIITLTAIYSYIEWKQTENHVGQLALQVATTVSTMPVIKDAFKSENPSEIIQPIAEQIRNDVGAEFIVVGNKDSIRYSHPDEWKIGKRMVGGDNDKALLEGKYYTSKAIGSLGPSLRGKAPIFDANNQIIGIVSVGFMQEDIQKTIYNRFIKISLFSFIVLLFGTLGGVVLAKNIRKDILGLEPYQIASLYRERSAILLSIKEGIIAVDENGIITMINHSAKKMLGISESPINQPIDTVFPNTQMYEVLESGKFEIDQEMNLNDRIVIVNRTPIIEKGQMVGVVATFRDKTEVVEMINTLSEVREYSEDLRAQTHEYTNKLYVLSGLLELGEYKEAIELIQSEYSIIQYQSKIIIEQIQDRKVQAILLGKIGKASEKKINFTIDYNSSLGSLPKHINISKLIAILGNIIDNAFEAVSNSSNKQVTFFTTDIGNDIIFEIIDYGIGIESEILATIFQKGYSTKHGNDRGYGLAIVNDIVQELNGSVEVRSNRIDGTIFTIYIPKIIEDII